MAIAENYSKEVLSHLSAIPVWEPGTRVIPGAMGRVRSGVFYEEGSLVDLWPDAPMETQDKAGRDERYFASSEVRLAKAAAEAKAGGVPAKAQASIKFERKGASVLHATSLKVSALSRLRDVLLYMDENKAAFEELAVVSHVEVADRFRVFCAESDDWSLDIAGNVSAVESLRIADASVSIASSSGAGYQASGSGAILLRLYVVRRRWLGKDTIQPLGLERGLPSADAGAPIVREMDPRELLE